jgi:hypothetical protein
VSEHLLILFEPGIQRSPVEADGAGEPFEQGAGHQPGGMGPVNPADAQPARLRDATAGLLGMSLRD